MWQNLIVSHLTFDIFGKIWLSQNINIAPLKNFNIISSNDQIYLENNYFLNFQDENIKNISFDIFDKEDKFIYSFVHGVDLSRKIEYEQEEKTGVIISTDDFVSAKLNWTVFDE